MKSIARLSLMALALGVTTTVFAQTASTAPAAAPAAKPVTQTTCADYVSLDETIKPKFIYYAVGHTANGSKVSVLDVAGTEQLKANVDAFCKVNLTASAYDKVMKESMASEKAAMKKKK